MYGSFQKKCTDCTDFFWKLYGLYGFFLKMYGFFQKSFSHPAFYIASFVELLAQKQK